MSYDYPAQGSVSYNVDLTGRHLRFLYRVDGDWAVHCFKAYSRYTRQWEVSDPINYWQYKVVANRLLFSKCYAGQTVAVDYTYFDGIAERKSVGETHRISDADDGSGFCFVDLAVPAGSTLRNVNAVVGTSFTVRIIWRDARAWRNIDMETTLTREL